MYQEVHTENISVRAQAPEIADLLGRFARFRLSASEGAPHEAFVAEIMPLFSDNLLIVRRMEDGDYAYLHYGKELLRYVPATGPGERISAMSPQVARFSKETFDQVLADGRPAYTIHRSLKTIRVCLWERIVLPTTAADGVRYLVVLSKPLQFREELLTMVLDTSPSGIVALQVLRDQHDEIGRTVIITANRQAAGLAGRPDESLLGCDAREAMPFLAEATVWQRIIYAIELRRSDMIELVFEREGIPTWLRVALAPLGDGLVLTMTDITDLVVANQTLRSRAATLALEIGRERATSRALCQELGQREEREMELRRLAETDPLTALLNRRSFIEKANAAIDICDQAGETTALIMVDLDHFKSVNDSHGHAAGDAVIRAFADLLLGIARPGRDLVGRFGGEEFAVFIPRADGDLCLRTAQKIQRELRRRKLPVSETLSLQVSASLGVATRHPGESFTGFIERADRALYRAKNEGRDRICQSDSAAEVQGAVAAA